MSWTKADGAKIKITFSLPLVGSVSESASSFTVTAQEYDFVPNGTLHNVVKAVNSVVGYTGQPESIDDAKSIVLEMKPLERFESAVGDIMVAYNGVGGLSGTGGQVAPFNVAFTPTELAYKGDQNDQEHVEISNITASSMLMKVNYTVFENQDQGHLEISNITAIGTLTHINNI